MFLLHLLTSLPKWLIPLSHYASSPSPSPFPSSLPFPLSPPFLLPLPTTLLFLLLLFLLFFNIFPAGTSLLSESPVDGLIPNLSIIHPNRTQAQSIGYSSVPLYSAF